MGKRKTITEIDEELTRLSTDIQKTKEQIRNLFKEVVHRYKRIEFEDPDDVSLIIKGDDNGDCSGNYHYISSIEECSNGDIGIEDIDEEVFFEEDIDTDGLLYLIDCILDEEDYK